MRLLGILLFSLSNLWLTGATPVATITSNPSIWESAAKGDVAQLDALLMSGRSPNARDSDGLTPLMHAAKNSQFGTLRHLLAFNVSLTPTTLYGQTALDMIPKGHTNSFACELAIKARKLLWQNERGLGTPPIKSRSVLLLGSYTPGASQMDYFGQKVRAHAQEIPEVEIHISAQHKRDAASSLLELGQGIAKRSANFDDYLVACHQQLLADSIVRGQNLSDHIRWAKLGIVSLTETEPCEPLALINHLAEIFASTKGMRREDTSSARIDPLAADFFLAQTAWLLIAAYENPNVLFIAPAGDETAGYYPVYASRLMPNVITVATTSQSPPASPTNIPGGLSADIIVPLASSADRSPAASAAVAGMAAYLRMPQPALTAAELKKTLIYAATPPNRLELTLTKDDNPAPLNMLLESQYSKTIRNYLHAKPGNILGDMVLSAATGALECRSEAYPEHMVDADKLTAFLIKNFRRASGWKARAEFYLQRGLHTEAETAAIEMLKRSSDWPGWSFLAEIQAKQSRFRWAILSYTQAIEIGKSAKKQKPNLAELYLKRANIHLALGNRTSAQADANTAKSLNPDIPMTDGLKAFYPSAN